MSNYAIYLDGNLYIVVLWDLIMRYRSFLGLLPCETVKLNFKFKTGYLNLRLVMRKK